MSEIASTLEALPLQIVGTDEATTGARQKVSAPSMEDTSATMEAFTGKVEEEEIEEPTPLLQRKQQLFKRPAPGS